MLKGLNMKSWIAATTFACAFFLSTGSAWSQATFTKTISPTPVSATSISLSTLIVPISGVTDSTTGIAKFQYVASEAGTLRVNIGIGKTAGSTIRNFNISTTETTFGATEDNKTFNFALKKNLGVFALSDESNTLGIDFKETGAASFRNIDNLVIFVDNVPPPPVSGISAEGADKSILVKWDAPARSGTEYVASFQIFYSEAPFTASATDAAKQKRVTVSTLGAENTEEVIKGLVNNQVYYVTMRAVDWVGFQSDFTRNTDGTIRSVQAQPIHTVSLSELAGEEGGCFIATAAFGSYQEPHVKILRRFRDQVLLQSSAGEAFVQWYYRASPPLANWIAHHEAARSVTRLALLPVYGLAYLSLHPSWMLTLGILLLMMAAGFRKPSQQESK